MKNHLKTVYDETYHDGLVFEFDDNFNLDIYSFTYEEKNKKHPKHEIGYKYHILTYKLTETGEYKNPDLFEAIIGDPHHYVSNLLSCGIFGSISKKTNKSNKIVKAVYNELLSIIKEQELEREYLENNPIPDKKSFLSKLLFWKS